MQQAEREAAGRGTGERVEQGEHAVEALLLAVHLDDHHVRLPGDLGQRLDARPRVAHEVVAAVVGQDVPPEVGRRRDDVQHRVVVAGEAQQLPGGRPARADLHNRARAQRRQDRLDNGPEAVHLQERSRSPKGRRC